MRPDTYGRITERARSQLGLICWRDLRDLRVRADAFRRLHGWAARCPHVFAHELTPRTWAQDVVSALLDAPPGAIATSVTALRLWDVPGYSSTPAIDVVVKRGQHHDLCSGARLHETFYLPDHHCDRRHGIDVVAARRVPFEVAALLRPSQLRWVIDFLVNERGLTVEQLALTVAELCRSGRPGSAEMRRQLEDLSPGYVPPNTVLAARFREMCVDHGLPIGEVELNVGGQEWIGRVDVVHRDKKVIFELDSRRWHNTRDGFESDRQRTNDLVLAGWRVIRITWRMIHDQPAKVADIVRRALCDA